MKRIDMNHFLAAQNKVLNKDLGNFNIFWVHDLDACAVQPIPYNRRDFYKINLLRGEYTIHLADKTYEIQKLGLFFGNPLYPYNWIPKGADAHSGVYCIFNKEFFHQFGNIDSYQMFQPEGDNVIELTEELYREIERVFEKMDQAFRSDYQHKYDKIRNLIFEVLHSANEVSTNEIRINKHDAAASRITRSFLELLERQFPIEMKNQQVLLRNAADFAHTLAIHENYLNRVLKKTMGSTTTQLIQQRFLQEARVLIRHSSIDISEIAYLLGFKEISHFSGFFKKNEGISPLQYRKV
ncbi:helix-turn-helix transcriptional regulator [Olivibacter sp. CPCC 100613]|uniref:helix-turn-helix domain-containing protein n=1 Tax=Olivibacter sp. CPCC 100613 TaxID=3079931 RepID=UPI002FF81BA2